MKKVWAILCVLLAGSAYSGEVQDWATTAAGNNTGSAPNFPVEGMSPSSVNDTMREQMAAIARWLADTNGTTTSGGSSNAYTLAANRAFTAYAAGDVFVFEANHSNTGASTLNVEAVGAKSIVTQTGVALTTGDIVSGGIYAVVYDGTNFQLFGAMPANVVSNSKLRDSGALSVIGRAANSSGDPADISASAASDAVLRESGSTIGFGTIATAGIADSAVATAKIADNAVTNDKIRDSGALSIIGRSANSSGGPADISATATSGAVLRESSSTIGFGTVSTNGIADAAITTVKIADNNLSTAKLQDEAVTYAKMQHVSASSRLLGRVNSGAGDVEEVTIGAGFDISGTTLSVGIPSGVMYRSGSQGPITTQTRIAFNATEYDNLASGAFNTSTNRYTANSDVTVQVTVRITANDLDLGDEMSMILRKNGTTTMASVGPERNDSGTNSLTRSLSLTKLVSLSATDYLEALLTSDTDGVSVASGASNSSFEVIELN